MLQHSFQRHDTRRTKAPGDGNLAPIGPDRAALARMVQTQDLLHVWTVLAMPP